MPSSSNVFSCPITTEVGAPTLTGVIKVVVSAPPQATSTLVTDSTSAVRACGPVIGNLPSLSNFWCLTALSIPAPLVRQIKERVIVEKRLDCVNR